MKFTPKELEIVTRALRVLTVEIADENHIHAKEANNKSPDLTHLIEIKQGDTLPLICNRVYGDPSYYMEVARYNNLVNFRKLVPGTKLYLPPIK